MPLHPVELSAPSLGQCAVLRARGREAINELTSWELVVVRDQPLDDPAAVLGEPGLVVLQDEAEAQARQIDLVIVEIAYQGREPRGAHRYALRLAPPEQALTLRAGYRVFIEKGTVDIVKQVLADAGLPASRLTAGLPASRLTVGLAGSYRQRLQCTQYDETEWAFLERLLAEEGISYFFDRDGDEGKMVLADNPGSHDGVVGTTVRYEEPTGIHRPRAFAELELFEEVSVGRVEVRDFDVRAPDVLIVGEAGSGDLSFFEYPAWTGDAAMAADRAQVRLEQLSRLRLRAEGVSDCIRVAAGRVLRLAGAGDDTMNVDYLVVAVEHQAERPGEGSGASVEYRNRVTMVPVGEAAFRPDAAAPGPQLSHVESAVVTGPAGEEIHVDDLGRIKLRFPWDPSGITDDRSSAWTRCLQMQLGGIMVLPRVGWEVAVGYLHGNPDAPLVLGRLYNATAVTPYQLPAAAATTSFQSATSPGGGSTNELRFVDDAGKEEFFIHASRDMSVKVGGPAKVEVAGDHTRDVGASLFEVIEGDQSNSVLGAETVNVGTDWVVQSRGSGKRFIGGLELQNASGNRLTGVDGTHFELLVPFYGVECNQSNIKVEGGHLQVVGGAMGFRSGLGFAESVAGLRVETVGAAYAVTASKGYGDTVYGPKRRQSSGAATENAGAKVTLEASSGVVKAATATFDGQGGPAYFKAGTMTVDAGKIVARALEISGGALRAKSGKTVIAGETVIKRPAGEKIK